MHLKLYYLCSSITFSTIAHNEHKYLPPNIFIQKVKHNKQKKRSKEKNIKKLSRAFYIFFNGAGCITATTEKQLKLVHSNWCFNIRVHSIEYCDVNINKIPTAGKFFIKL